MKIENALAVLDTPQGRTDLTRRPAVTKPTEVPLCKCHDVPMLWQKKRQRRSGGSWYCRIKSREKSRRYAASPEGRQKHLEAMRRYAGSEKGRKTNREGNRRWRTDPRPASTTGQPVGYSPAHQRHGKVLPRECALADQTCKGRLEVALKQGTPEHKLLGAVGGSEHGLFYSLDPEDYMRLCHSHHVRYDGQIMEAVKARWAKYRASKAS